MFDSPRVRMYISPTSWDGAIRSGWMKWERPWSVTLFVDGFSSSDYSADIIKIDLVGKRRFFGSQLFCGPEAKLLSKVSGQRWFLYIVNRKEEIRRQQWLVPEGGFLRMVCIGCIKQENLFALCDLSWRTRSCERDRKMLRLSFRVS